MVTGRAGRQAPPLKNRWPSGSPMPWGFPCGVSRCSGGCRTMNGSARIRRSPTLRAWPSPRDPGQLGGLQLHIGGAPGGNGAGGAVRFRRPRSGRAVAPAPAGGHGRARRHGRWHCAHCRLRKQPSRRSGGRGPGDLDAHPRNTLRGYNGHRRRGNRTGHAHARYRGRSRRRYLRGRQGPGRFTDPHLCQCDARKSRPHRSRIGRSGLAPGDGGRDAPGSVTDQWGNYVEGVLVTWEVVEGGGAIDPGEGVTVPSQPGSPPVATAIHRLAPGDGPRSRFRASIATGVRPSPPVSTMA
jgi:hypothetical protein